MMVNGVRGEAVAMLAGTERRLCLTLGALAEIETGLGVAGMAALDQLLLGTCHSNVFDLARSITASHHEHLDGSGYPHALRGATIPLAARIVAVADAFVAMTSLRPHRPALMPSAVCAEIEAAAGTLYDPRIVEALLDVVDRGVGKQ